MQAVDFEGFVVFFRLIQSQTQGGPGSAALHDGNADGGVDIMLSQILLEIFLCDFSYFKHGSHLLSWDGKGNFLFPKAGKTTEIEVSVSADSNKFQF
jgi:hypothetical protein